VSGWAVIRPELRKSRNSPLLVLNESYKRGCQEKSSPFSPKESGAVEACIHPQSLCKREASHILQINVKSMERISSRPTMETKPGLPAMRTTSPSPLEVSETDEHEAQQNSKDNKI